MYPSLPRSIILRLDFGTVPTVWYFDLCFSFYWLSRARVTTISIVS